MTGIEKAIKKAGGSASEVAKRITARGRKCLRQDVQYWLRVGYVTPNFAPLVCEEFDVPLHELNSAVYPKRLTA